MPSVVQFVHPGAEPPQRLAKSGQISWHTYSKEKPNSHWRKFLLGTDASYRGKNGRVLEGKEIAFWGEWEPDSETHTIYGGHPYSLQAPSPDYKRPKGEDFLSHTTDPFVFGERFYLSHCRQNSYRALRNLEPGSVLLFGSQSGKNGKYEFYLDTVMVVGNSRSLHDFKPDQAIHRDFSRTNVGLLDKQTRQSLTLYEGQMYDDNRKLFSYVPCRPLSNDSQGFPKPNILSENIVANFSGFFWNRPQRNCKITPGRPDEIQDLWNAVLQEVYAADLYAGWGMESPGGNRREPDIVSPQSGPAC